MNKRLIIAALIATATLSGCVTYDHVGRGVAPGGYYHGRPTTEYYGPYGYGGYPYSGGVSVYRGYGGGGYYGGYPYYGHYDSYYPYYPPRYYPRPPRPGDGRPPPPKPPPTSRPGNRPPPWRDPTNGAYRETGQVLIPPRSQPQYQRPAPSSSQIRGDNPPRMAPRQEPRNEVSRPRSIERPNRPAVRSAPRVRTQEP